MNTSISRHPSDALPAGGPPLVILPAKDALAPDELYRRGISSPLRCPANDRVVALIRTPVLSSPDMVAANAGEWRDRLLTVELEIRSFTGALLANDPWVALVKVEMGSLAPGTYEILARTTRLEFSHRNHPETAGRPSVTEQRWRFECS